MCVPLRRWLFHQAVIDSNDGHESLQWPGVRARRADSAADSVRLSSGTELSLIGFYSTVRRSATDGSNAVT